MSVDVPVPTEEAVDMEAAAAPEMVPPIDWWALPDREKALLLLELEWFTRRLVQTYALPSEIVPPCWWRSEGLIVELLTLKQTRETNYLPGMPGEAMSSNGEHMSVTLERMRVLVQRYGCASSHRPAKIPAWALDGREMVFEEDANLQDAVMRLGGFDSPLLADIEEQLRRKWVDPGESA